jgi:hypothetical protein
MASQNLIGIMLLLVACSSLCYAIYVKLRSNSYTRERYAFAVLSAEMTLVILAIHSITAKPFWATLPSAWAQLTGSAQTPEQSVHWSEEVLVVLLVVFAITMMNRTLIAWNGLISVEQKERETLREPRSWWIDAIEEASRVFRRKPPLAVYRPHDYSRSNYHIEAPRDTLAWHENARELVTLRWRTHTFSSESAWHPQANTWVGQNSKTLKAVALLCLHDFPTPQEVENFISYVRQNPATQSDPEFIIAVQKSGGARAEKVDGVEVLIETEDSLVANLVDFTDYFNEINRRVTQDYLPDSALTISDVYVSPYGAKEIESRSDVEVDELPEKEPDDSFELDEYLKQWSAEQSNRQIAILGEYGQGKSTVALKFTFDMIPLVRKGDSRIPLLIELRGKSPSTLQPLEFLGAWASAYRIEPKALLKLIVLGRTILIFEGFDEMAESGDLESRVNHFRALWRLCYPRNKIIITGRPNFFLDEQELQAALATHDRTGAGPYCEPVYLRFFEGPQISFALRWTDAETTRQILSLYKEDRKFREIVSRPSLLYIVALLWKDRLAAETDIDSAHVLDLFIRHIYLRQALKAQDDRGFMLLSLAEREYFLDGIAAYMVAKSLRNQILPEQFHDAVSRLFPYIPEDLFKKSSAMEPDQPIRPLAERIKGRPHPLEDVETDVRTYGILVRDYSRPGALKYPHKSFFELIFAQYVADRLVGENRKERSAIDAATDVKIERVMDMPESIAFIGEILERRRKGKSGEVATLNSLFNSIVFGGKFALPNWGARVVIFEHAVRWQRPKTALERLVRFLPPSMWLMVFTMFLMTFFVFEETFRVKSGDQGLGFAVSLEHLLLLTVIALAGFSTVFSSLGLFSLRDRMDLWRLVISSLGFGEPELKRAYGRRIAELVLQSGLKGSITTLPKTDLEVATSGAKANSDLGVGREP